MKKIDNAWTYDFLLQKIEELEAEHRGKKMPADAAEDLETMRLRVSAYETRVGMMREDYCER